MSSFESAAQAEPDIRIEPLDIVISNVQDEKSIAAPEIEASDSPYFHFVDGKRAPLRLISEEIAVTFAPEKAGGALDAIEAVAPGATASELGLPGVRLVQFSGAAKSAGDIEAMVDALADSPEVSFASPVFEGNNGHKVILTSDVLCRFRGDVENLEHDDVLAATGAFAVIEQEFGGLSRAYKLRAASKNGFTVLNAVNALAQHPAIAWAEPDAYFTGSSNVESAADVVASLPRAPKPAFDGQGSLIPNDPGFDNCWGIRNTGQFAGGLPDFDMDGDEAWNTTLGAPSVKVLIIDTGVQQDHPDINQDPGTDVTSDDGDGGPVNEFDDHGTPVAGCVSAIINNALGTVGIAPDSKSVSVRTFIAINNSGNWSSQVSWTVNALAFGETAGVRVTNNSNYYGFSSNAIADKYAQTRDDGMVHFAAAGNFNTGSLSYPSSLPSVNAIAALDDDGDIASFSSYGPGLAFSAPGVSIYSTDRQGAEGYSSNDYTFISGTSFASPYTAGVAALILSLDDSLTAAEVEGRLAAGARDLGAAGYDTMFGHGLVNAKDSLLSVGCSDFESFTIYNDGLGVLSVDDMQLDSEALWLSWTPAVPFEVYPGESQRVVVCADFAIAPMGTTTRQLSVFSNDPDESPYPGGVTVHTVNGFVDECNLTLSAGPSGAPNPVMAGQAAQMTVTPVDDTGLMYLWTSTRGVFINPALQEPVWRAPRVCGGEPFDVEICAEVLCLNGDSELYCFNQTVIPETPAISIASLTASPLDVACDAVVELAVEAELSCPSGPIAYQWSDDGCLGGGTFSEPNAAAAQWTPPVNDTGAPVECELTVQLTAPGAEPVEETVTVTVQPCVAQECGLRIADASGAIGDSVFVPVLVGNALNELDEVGFDVVYDDSVLTFVDASAGDLTINWDLVQVSDVGAGTIRIDAMTTANEIPAGASGAFVTLEFAIAEDAEFQEESLLCLQNFVGDVAAWPNGEACCGVVTVGCCRDGDANLDCAATPGDALLAFEHFLEQIVLSACQQYHADVNSPATVPEITPGDALCIFQHFLEQPSCLTFPQTCSCQDGA